VPGRPAAARTRRTSSRRARGVGVPGSSTGCSSGSRTASETETPTGTFACAALSSGRSRLSSVPLVKIENGVSLAVSAEMMSGISR